MSRKVNTPRKKILSNTHQIKLKTKLVKLREKAWKMEIDVKTVKRMREREM